MRHVALVWMVLAWVLALAAPAMAQTAEDADALNAKVVRLYEAGKHVEAIPIAKRALAFREKAKEKPAFATIASETGAYPTEVVPIIRHANELTAVAFSPDGTLVITGSSDDTAKLWDVATGRLVRTLEGHAHSVTSVAFSPDGQHVVSGSNDKTLRLWEVTTGRLIHTFAGHSDRVGSVVFSPDGSRVLSGSNDKTVKLWEARSGWLLRTFEGHSNFVTEVAFSPDGSRVLSGSWDKTLRLWDAGTGRLIHTFEGHLGYVSAVAFSTDGLHVLSGDWGIKNSDNTLRLWDAGNGQLLRAFEGHTDFVHSVAFSPDGTAILSGSLDGTVRLWKAATGEVIRSFEAHTGGVDAVAFSPDGASVVSAGGGAWGTRDGKIVPVAHTAKLWNAGTGQLIRTFGEYASGLTSVAASPDGAYLLSGSHDRTMRLWDPMGGRLIRTFSGLSAEVSSVAYSPDGTRALSWGWDKTLSLWDITTGQLIRTFEGHLSRVNAAAFSPDGSQVLSGSQDRTVKLWDVATGQVLRTFEGHAFDVLSVAFSPVGARVLSGSFDQTLKLWDAATGQLMRTWRYGPVMSRATQPVRSVAFSPDGGRVFSVNVGTILESDVNTGKLLRAFEGHAVWVNSVVISDDGAHMLSGSEDKTLKLWDLTTGRLLRTLAGHLAGVNRVAFLSGAPRLLSVSGDSTVRIWNEETGELLASLLAADDGEWIVITPQGFFSASSPRAAQLLTIVRGLEVYSVDQMWQSLYSPDLVREALTGDPDKEVERAAAVTNLDKVLDSGKAPLVKVTSHSTGAKSANEVITVEATITEQERGGVGRIEWRVNGITVGVSNPPSGSSPEVSVKRTLALDPGESTIEVIAYNGRNLLASVPEQTNVTWTGTADAAKPTLHVLAIGINAYTDQGWTPPGRRKPVRFGKLGLAVKDATTFSEAMTRTGSGLYQDVKVTLALDGDATRGGLQKLVDKLAKEIDPRDTFILFAAAHGTSEQGRFYLIPQDYQSGPNALLARAIGQDVLQDWLANRIRAKKAIVLLDTCESGALVAGHLRSRLEAAASDASVGRLHEATGRPVLTAAASGQFAHEGLIGQAGARHGVFTWALLDALRNGDTSGNGWIEVSELVSHVQGIVPKLAADLGGMGRAATAVRKPVFGEQAARFGSRGEDFVLTQRLN